ncbi:MAG TPA: hypothetical protein VFJ01_08450, partial [Oleiagrimonas sp.]|nr:hypothetical protein [Oleiagrimonas sp.]
MNIKSFCTLGTAALLLGFAGISFAASSTKPETHSLPVLVKVDSHGKVTSVKPAVELTPPVMQLLKKTLSTMITKPAHDKKGRPIESQIAMVMSVNSIHHEDGKYGVKFGYVSMQPVPTGRWHWSYNGHHYSLV